MKYLDKTGLQYLWNKIKAHVPDLSKKTVSIPFGQVDASSTSTVYTATVDGITELRDGVCMFLRNGDVTSASGYTININGLGAKPVYQTLTGAVTTTVFTASFTGFFVYNEDRIEGGCWDLYYGYYANTNTIGYQLRTNSSSMIMKSATYRYRLLFTTRIGQGWVPANNSSSTNATAKRTVCQDEINPWGRIVYYSGTAAVSAGSRPSAASLWSQYTITLGYSFNRTGAALNLTAWHPVYVKCSPTASGGAIIDPDEPIVQGLPETEDGFIYIFLGTAYSATAVEIVPEHPVYYFKNGAIRIWTNAE